MPESAILNKLRLKEGQRAAVLAAPESYRVTLIDIPAGVEIAETLDGSFDFVHWFVTERAEVIRRVAEVKSALRPGGLLWISYPKGKALPTDLNRDVLRELLAGYGLDAVAQVAIDEVWSALRFKAPDAGKQPRA